MVFCFRIEWRSTTCFGLVDDRKVLKAYVLVVFVFSVFRSSSFSYFQKYVECFITTVSFSIFCFRINWRVNTCCSLSGHSESKSLLIDSVCVFRLFF